MRMGDTIFYFDRNDNTLHSAKYLSSCNHNMKVGNIYYLLTDTNEKVAIRARDAFYSKEMCIMKTLNERTEYLNRLKRSEEETIATIKKLKKEKSKLSKKKLKNFL